MKDSDKILIQRAKEYGSYGDNANFIHHWFNAIKITHNLLDVHTDSLAYLTKTMTGLKIIRLKNSKNTSSIKDCVIDFFNYWYLNANEIEKIDKNFEMKVVYFWDTHSHLLGDNKLVKECINLITKEVWNSLNKEKIKWLSDEVLDLFNNQKDEINLFNYQEKIKS